MAKKKGSSVAKQILKRRIIIKDEEHGLPYSKGLITSSIMATGLAPQRAYDIAARIEDYLRENEIFSVSIKELRDLTAKMLRKQAGEEYAERYLQWQALSKLEKPLIILVGGTTGVGKSTVATELAHRLGITRIVSTDALREVMRAVFSEELMPTLYDSSFTAWRALRTPLPPDADPVIAGFREQTLVVSVGIRAVIERAIKEGLSMIIEGIHVVPGFLNVDYYRELKNAFVIPIVITVEDEELHKSHFYVRDLETDGFRPLEKYRRNFGNIRKIGKYIEELAQKEKIPIISSENLDTTVSRVLEAIMEEVMKAGNKERKKERGKELMV